MKISISREFDSIDAALAFMESMESFDRPMLTETEMKRARKRRSDVGQPRGSYKVAAPQAGNGESSISAAARTDGAGGGTTSPADAAAPTKEQAHNTLKLMGATKGLGTPACIDFLRTFGVERFSDLKPEFYPQFVDKALAKIAEFADAEGAEASLPGRS